MAGESAHFGLRDRPPTPAVHAFQLPPRLKPMLDRANASLAEPFRGIAGAAADPSGLFCDCEDRRLAGAARRGGRDLFLQRSVPISADAACFAITATRPGGSGPTSILG